MNTDTVVLVDSTDHQTGLMEKLDAHRGKGMLHRAVSVLLYRTRHGETEVLLQQRSHKKPLWPLYWSNTVCTHPRNSETPVNCARRRLQEEMGIADVSLKVTFLFTLLYQAKYDETLSEHELDHVFVGEWDGEYFINRDEVDRAKWIKLDDLIDDITIHASIYTPWLIRIIKHNDALYVLRHST